MDVTLFGSILCDELWICSNAVENPFVVGTCHAWAFYHPDTHKPDKSPKNKWQKTFKSLMKSPSITASFV
jgi:hypothetical protein